MSEQFEVVTVFSIGNLALLAYAKSDLHSAGPERFRQIASQKTLAMTGVESAMTGVERSK